ncbi:uncharacterized protein LOC110721757 [Chenopodium quinoa]|uniref:uncharacterized protein LOC110721757 n=1 Tax=Chenopodium quinoa TaxID=63459 RepID=UPI000B77C988|nr:uncharacterized protein LOC110721757 [Chenopodium quinoa]
MVIITGIVNHNFWRTLIDGGGGANILFQDAFDQLKLQSKDLSPVPYPVSRFNGSATYPDGKITLPVTIGRDRAAQNVMAEFLVMDVPSVYNVIMGRPMIHQIQGVVSTYHQMMIYVSDKGHSERIQGSQEAARKCNYFRSSKERREDKDDEEKEREKDRSTKK